MRTCCMCKKIKEDLEFSPRLLGKEIKKPRCIKCFKIYYRKYKKQILKRNVLYKNKHKEKFKKIAQNYNIKNKKIIKEKRKEYYNSHKEQYYLYYQKHKEDKRIYNRKYEKNRKENDLNFKIRRNMRTRLCQALKDNQKSGSAIENLGCTIETLKLYLESKFQPGMTWENWSLTGWHIDHIISLSSFDLTNKDQFLKACHYTNLQPLWAKDNYRKNKF